MTTPARYDLEVYRGDTNAWTFTLWTDEAATVPMDLTGYVAHAQVRTKPGAPTVLAELAATVELPNTVRVDLDAEGSAALPTCGGAWDLQLTNGTTGHVRTVLAGAVHVTADVTAALEAVTL